MGEGLPLNILSWNLPTQQGESELEAVFENNLGVMEEEAKVEDAHGMGWRTCRSSVCYSRIGDLPCRNDLSGKRGGDKDSRRYHLRLPPDLDPGTA